MYSSIYRVQSSTRRLPIRALFGFTLKLVESYLSFPSESLCGGLSLVPTLGRLKVPVLPVNPRIQTHYGMSSCSGVNDDPLAIIHLYLAGMDPNGSPPRLVYKSFQTYFHPNNLLFVELEFDAGTPTKEANHQSKMANLVDKSQCAQFARVLIFISTHSEETRGDLFLGYCGQ